jgi:hypothetical protein
MLLVTMSLAAANCDADSDKATRAALRTIADFFMIVSPWVGLIFLDVGYVRRRW